MLYVVQPKGPFLCVTPRVFPDKGQALDTKLVLVIEDPKPSATRPAKQMSTHCCCYVL